MTKIAFLYDGILDIGGVESQILSIIRSDYLSSYSFLVYSQFSERFLGKIAEENVKTVNLSRRHPINPITPFETARILKAEEVDLVHAHSPTAALWGRIASRLINIPAVVTVHLPVGLYHGSLETHRARLGRRVYKKLDRWLNHQLSFTKKIIYVSENVYDSEIKSGQSDPYNSIVIRNGIDLEPFNQIARANARSKFNLPQNTKIIIFVGRLDEQKGVDILVDAVRILNKNQDDFQVWLLGDGENRKNIEDQVRDSDLNGKVILWGFQENIPLYLMASDIFVLPSRYEGMSIALLNGLAAGLPCIVSGVGESDLIVKDGINGIVIPPNDVGSLVKALETLLSTDNLCKRLSESAKLSAADYTEDIMVEQIEQVYNECLEL